MKIVTIIARILLGAGMVVFGLNKFLNFMPPPEGLPAPALNFLGALIGSGYLFQVIAVVEIVCGALILLGFLVPLALTVLAPVTINIVLFHVFLAPTGVAPGLVFLGLNLFLLIAYKSRFDGLLKA